MDEAVLSCSVGAMAYNEEKNIRDFLDSLLRQKLKKVEIKEIIVVTSGCTDRTEDIVKEYLGTNPKIRLISQPKRRGKASAINLFLKYAKCDILVETSTDLILQEDTIENLVIPFLNTDVGMTGVQPRPIYNKLDSFMKFAVNLLWELHHRISLDTPKSGEMVAFRNVIEEIPYDTAVDEAAIEALIRRNGYRLYYAENAIVRNRGPKGIQDFLVQRRRIHAGHLWLRKNYQYMVATEALFKVFREAIRYLCAKPKYIFWIIGSAGLEFFAMVLGNLDFYLRDKNPFIWKRVDTQ